jgi:hypothetical protein
MKRSSGSGLAVICVTTAAAGSVYLLAAQVTAGAAAGADRSSARSATAPACTVPRQSSADATEVAAKGRDIEQLARALGVSLDRLGQATAASKEAGIRPTDPRAAGFLAQQLGLDPAVVQAALAQLMSKYPFNQPDVVCEAPPVRQTRPAGAINPKTAALSALARTLNVSVTELMRGLTVTEAHGVRTIDDPRLPDALALALGLDPSTVRSAMAGMLDKPPFSRGAEVASAAGTRK